ncbi:MAG: hypothetical protein WC811_03035 [Hyphomicrobium sp.]|jgi:ATPase subunit of ABC transporter with duplicated ATPase domains
MVSKTARAYATWLMWLDETDQFKDGEGAPERITNDRIDAYRKYLENDVTSLVTVRSLLHGIDRAMSVISPRTSSSHLKRCANSSLLFQETQIEQLSPGQRGALLLIFYLLVDTGRNPIVLDQPEENLDNETVVSLLVPVLNEAKKSRQIIMVTHNPNLAVVCDAEQIIHATFDRKNGARISYHSGSIEDGTINRAVVDVLEGTKVAFDNRGQKYH